MAEKQERQGGSGRGLGRWAFELAHSPLGPSSARNRQASSGSARGTTNIQVLNSQLIAHGFIKKAIHFERIREEGESGTEDSGRLKEAILACLLAMLEKRADDLDSYESLTARYRSLTAELARAESASTQTKTQLRLAQRQIDVFNAEKAADRSTSKSSQSQLRDLKADAAKAKANLVWIRAQASGDVKRMEKEQARLTERLTRMSDEQARLGRSGIRYANPDMAPKSLGLAPTSASDTDTVAHLQSEGQRVVESRMRALEGENRQVLDSFTNFFHQISQLLPDGRVLSQSTEPPTSLELESSVQELKAKLLPMKRVEPLPRTEPDINTNSRQTLETELAEAQRTVEDLQKKLQDLAAEKFDRQDSSADASLTTERLQIDLERQKFAEASARLANERAGFEAERIAWLEEQRHTKRLSLTRTPLVERRLASQSNAPAPAPTAPSAAGSSVVGKPRARLSMSPAPRLDSAEGMKSGARRESRASAPASKLSSATPAKPSAVPAAAATTKPERSSSDSPRADVPDPALAPAPVLVPSDAAATESAPTPAKQDGPPPSVELTGARRVSPPQTRPRNPRPVHAPGPRPKFTLSRN